VLTAMGVVVSGTLAVTMTMTMAMTLAVTLAVTMSSETQRGLQTSIGVCQCQ